MTTAHLPSLDIGTPLDPVAQPWPLLHQLLADAPISWIPALNAYLLVRRADVTAALKDKALSNTGLTQNIQRLPAEQRDALQPVYDSVVLWMGHTVPEDHKRFQNLLKRYFTPRTVNGLRPRIAEITQGLIDRAGGDLEVVSGLAYPLPASVIAEMLGMPLEDREQLQLWSRDITALFGGPDFEALSQAQRSVLEMQDYLRPLLDARRLEPREDLLTVFAAAERDGLVTEAEIVANCVLLLFAGHETTASLIANGTKLLLDNPGQVALLRADPSLVPGAVEEMMRMGGPATFIPRIAAAPVEIAGQTFPEGTRFFLGLATANRDPEHYPDPDRFDVTRANAGQQIGFGMGTYYCLGAALARAEADECFRILLTRDVELVSAAVQPIFPLSEGVAALYIRV
ncbi:cytochrome P450 [Lentzea sp. NBRC 105346]|uniref:cytochrome P450 n=1 Tax=Lentzea sp. NBRC 105346 TaxID=3032205 RepID=UPI0024A3E120|nr:cytochrome P450 [Lentzea sp. NBRC 105346]GLZ28470.1 cytochrome P450 [Lentzea sp. NBRC 105346]